MTLLDNIITGNISYMNQPSVSLLKKAVPILKHLLFRTDKNKLDSFIYQTFDVFIGAKESIKINMNSLNKYIVDKTFLDLLFGGTGFKRNKLKEQYDNKYMIYSDETNLLNVLNIFSNLRKLNIENSQFYNEYWSFSLHRLLELIENTCIESVVVHACCAEGASLSWLYCAWESMSSSSIAKFENKGFSIEYIEDDYKHYIHVSRIKA